MALDGLYSLPVMDDISRFINQLYVAENTE